MANVLAASPSPAGTVSFSGVPKIPHISVPGVPGLNTASLSQILSHPTWDIVLIFALISIGFFYGMSRGRHKMVSSVLNTYIALAVFGAMPIASIARYLNLDNLFIIKTGVFFIIFLPLAFFMNRGRPRYLHSNMAWWQVFCLSFIQAGLLLHIIFSFLPAETIKNLAPMTRSFFANTNLTVWWLVLPLLFMIFLRRSGRDD